MQKLPLIRLMRRTCPDVLAVKVSRYIELDRCTAINICALHTSPFKTDHIHTQHCTHTLKHAWVASVCKWTRSGLVGSSTGHCTPGRKVQARHTRAYQLHLVKRRACPQAYPVHCMSECVPLWGCVYKTLERPIHTNNRTIPKLQARRIELACMSLVGTSGSRASCMFAYGATPTSKARHNNKQWNANAHTHIRTHWIAAKNWDIIRRGTHNWRRHTFTCPLQLIKAEVRNSTGATSIVIQATLLTRDFMKFPH